MSASKFDTSSFVQQRSDVAEADRSMSHRRGGVALNFDPREARLVLVGLPGSGKEQLASLLAQRLDLEAVIPDESTDPATVAALAARTGIVLAAPVSAVKDDEVRARLREGSRVYYLMADAVALAGAKGLVGDAREAFCREALDLEVTFMGMLHMMLAEGKKPEEMARNVLESLGIVDWSAADEDGALSAAIDRDWVAE